MGAPLVVRCPAKLNLFLEVVRRRPDGYHDLDTIMQAIDLYDDLEIAPRQDSKVTFECSDPRLPADETNLVVRAALALREQVGLRGGAHFRLTKRIPSGAGLGGGSSDAAGALAGLNALWGLGLSPVELARVAAAIGSDVAFFLAGGTARCTGRGERVEPLGEVGPFHYVVVCPPLCVATAAVYGNLRFPLTGARERASMQRRNLLEGNVEGVGRGLFNRLETAAFGLYPSLADSKARLAASGCFVGVAMTGSGSALFGLCRPADVELAVARTAAMALGKHHKARNVHHGVQLGLR